MKNVSIEMLEIMLDEKKKIEILPNGDIIVEGAILAEFSLDLLRQLRRDALELCWQIEKFSASELQTETVSLASAILDKLNKVNPIPQEFPTYAGRRTQRRYFRSIIR